MDVVRWRFHDAHTGETWVMPLNPNAADLPGVKRQPKYQATAGPDGAVLIFIGRDEVQQFKVSGTILDRTFYAAMLLWARKRYPIQVTDDLGNVFGVLVEEFTPTRKWSAHKPWRMTYNATFTVTGWSGP